MIKDGVFLVVRIAGEGTTATCFYDRYLKEIIKFKNDHMFAF